ncbi:uncharacterized protein LOC132022102 isoform X2 [Mustela nigripes]|uniref:uncharacterized protein LOC132022102 isoform X2 n=1 Tax=Mustela nigripes TaxID=77151 RepID=UPI00281538A2|nr:uncharacterized protein LOC132022102 isoform X2 [Mustela nigripes]
MEGWPSPGRQLEMLSFPLLPRLCCWPPSCPPHAISYPTLGCASLTDRPHHPLSEDLLCRLSIGGPPVKHLFSLSPRQVRIPCKTEVVPFGWVNVQGLVKGCSKSGCHARDNTAYPTPLGCVGTETLPSGPQGCGEELHPGRAHWSCPPVPGMQLRRRDRGVHTLFLPFLLLGSPLADPSRRTLEHGHHPHHKGWGMWSRVRWSTPQATAIGLLLQAASLGWRPLLGVGDARMADSMTSPSSAALQLPSIRGGGWLCFPGQSLPDEETEAWQGLWPHGWDTLELLSPVSLPCPHPGLSESFSPWPSSTPATWSAFSPRRTAWISLVDLTHFSPRQGEAFQPLVRAGALACVNEKHQSLCV